MPRPPLHKTDVTLRFSEVVRRIRMNSGLRISDLAGRVGMTASQWSKVENRPRKDISVVLFIRVAAALSLSGTQLMAIVETAPSELSSSGN